MDPTTDIDPFNLSFELRTIPSYTNSKATDENNNTANSRPGSTTNSIFNDVDPSLQTYCPLCKHNCKTDPSNPNSKFSSVGQNITNISFCGAFPYVSFSPNRVEETLPTVETNSRVNTSHPSIANEPSHISDQNPSLPHQQSEQGNTTEIEMEIQGSSITENQSKKKVKSHQRVEFVRRDADKPPEA